VNRRRFLKLSAGAFGAVICGGGAAVVGSERCRVHRVSIGIANLPAQFVGTTIAFLSDIHHSDCVPLAYIRHVVKMTNALKPDFIALGGDYITHGRRFVAPCIAELAELRAAGGVFAVLGNHDHYDQAAPVTRAEMRNASIVELTNRGVWLEKNRARLRLCGVGDYWRDTQDIHAALGDAQPGDATILLSHNPDYVERIRDQRVGLVLSGHTHGGQVVLPFFGAPCVPSRYGRQGPVARVFVTRGVGMISPPVRFRCPAEVALITLAPRHEPHIL
jgi:predicted MPP superfamily phosphohydrolase